MIDLYFLINSSWPKLAEHVHRWKDGADPWSGCNVSPQAMQACLDSCVTWAAGVTPPTGQQVFDAIPAYLASLNAGALAARAAAIAAKRYEKEVGGITVNGVAIPSDRDTQMKMMAARIRAKENPAYTVNWKTLTGFVALDAAAVIAIADAMARHVQDCFDHEAALLADPQADINAG